MTTSSLYFDPENYSLKPKHTFFPLFNPDHFSLVLPMKV